MDLDQGSDRKKTGLRLMEAAQVALGRVGFPSQSIGRMSSWAELRTVWKKEQPLEKGMQRKRKWIRDMRRETCNRWASRAGDPGVCEDAEGWPGLENRRLERLRSGLWSSAV